MVISNAVAAGEMSMAFPLHWLIAAGNRGGSWRQTDRQTDQTNRVTVAEPANHKYWTGNPEFHVCAQNLQWNPGRRQVVFVASISCDRIRQTRCLYTNDYWWWILNSKELLLPFVTTTAVSFLAVVQTSSHSCLKESFSHPFISMHCLT